MGFKMTIVEKDGYLHFRVSGKNTPENIIDYLAEAYKECVRLNCPVVLIEENLLGPSVSMAAALDIVAKATKQTSEYVQRVAFVDVNPEHSSSLLKFAETAAISRGLNIRVFSSLSIAEKWICFPDTMNFESPLLY